MKIVAQSLDDVLASLTPLAADGMDETALRVVAKLQELPIKTTYTNEGRQSTSRRALR